MGYPTESLRLVTKVVEAINSRDLVSLKERLRGRPIYHIITHSKAAILNSSARYKDLGKFPRYNLFCHRKLVASPRCRPSKGSASFRTQSLYNPATKPANFRRKPFGRKTWVSSRQEKPYVYGSVPFCLSRVCSYNIFCMLQFQSHGKRVDLLFNIASGRYHGCMRTSTPGSDKALSSSTTSIRDGRTVQIS